MIAETVAQDEQPVVAAPSHMAERDRPDVLVASAVHLAVVRLGDLTAGIRSRVAGAHLDMQEARWAVSLRATVLAGPLHAQVRGLTRQCAAGGGRTC